MSQHIYTYDNPPSEKDLTKAVQVLENDGVICYPMESNWAFGCDAANSKALSRIRQLKPTHPKEQPFSLICSNISMASEVGVIEHSTYRFLKKIWPGPYTVLLVRNRSLPKQIKNKRPIVGVRVPQSPLVLALVEKFGKPLATTSLPAKADGELYRMGWDIFEDFSHGIDMLLDLGAELTGEESTIVDFSSGSPELIRAGTGDVSVFGFGD